MFVVFSYLVFFQVFFYLIMLIKFDIREIHLDLYKEKL